METNYTIPSSFVAPLQNKNGNNIAQIGSIGKTFVFSLFVGTQLVVSPIWGLPRDVNLLYNYSPSSYTCYVNLDDSRECVNSDGSLFLDFQKYENLEKLKRMSSFSENWNGVGGQMFTETAISVFTGIIENVCKQPTIAPTGRNSLLLQYELDDHSILAFEVKETCTEMVCVPLGDYSFANSQTFTNNIAQEINSQVARFYGFEDN